MKTIIKMMVAVVWLVTCALTANAASSVLAPDADADIRSKDLADIGYDRETLVVGNTNPDPSAVRCYKAYVRFKLPVDFGEATSATFTITRAVLGSYDAPYSVSLLNDGVSGETDWVEANTTGMNWNNAPGNVTTSPSAFDNSTVVGTFTTLKAANGGVAGDSWSISGAELVNALNQDSNGYVTLMIGRTNQSSSYDQFASRSHATYAAPELALEYTPSGVELSPDADADIRSADLADIGYNRETLLVGNTNPDPSAARCYKAYIRFQLPADFSEAENASFTISRAVLGAYDASYSVSLLDDGVSGEADWLEANTTGISWNNAPGNVTTSPSAFDNSTVVGTFTTLKAANGGVLGDSWSISGTNLVNALNQDSNGYVTLMIARTTQSSSSDQFVSKENATYDAPKLWLDYTPVAAVQTVLVPNADADIRSYTSATNSHDRDILAVINRYSDPSAGIDAKAYIRYKLPADFGAALSATFTISRTVVGAYDAPYSVSGLNDGVSGEADWVERDSFYVGPGGMTWNNAPGNDTSSPYGFIDSTVVGTFTVLKEANGGFVGDSWSINGSELVDFINEDSNGYVTLMIGRTEQSSSSDQFASSENTNSFAPPTLTLQYVSAPAYEAWIGRYPGVGVGTNMTDDADGDSLNNLIEFALGGDPSDPADTGCGPEVGTVVNGDGTNWFTFVHAQRSDAATVGLSYHVEQCSDLVNGSWTNSLIEVTGTGVWDTAEFDAVTNRIMMNGESQQFLRLIIESE